MGRRVSERVARGVECETSEPQRKPRKRRGRSLAGGGGTARFVVAVRLGVGVAITDGADVLAASHGTGTTRDDSQPASEIAITILSNLLSANIDVGLKHSLSIGYHENVEIRTAFIKVLCNILVQGTEFNNLSDTAVSEKYDELLVVRHVPAINLPACLGN